MADIIHDGYPTKIEVAEYSGTPTYTELPVDAFVLDGNAAGEEPETYKLLSNADAVSSRTQSFVLPLRNFDATAGKPKPVLDALVGKRALLRITRNGVVATHGTASSGLYVRVHGGPTIAGAPATRIYTFSIAVGSSVENTTYA